MSFDRASFVLEVCQNFIIAHQLLRTLHMPVIQRLQPRTLFKQVQCWIIFIPVMMKCHGTICIILMLSQHLYITPSYGDWLTAKMEMLLFDNFIYLRLSFVHFTMFKFYEVESTHRLLWVLNIQIYGKTPKNMVLLLNTFSNALNYLDKHLPVARKRRVTASLS